MGLVCARYLIVASMVAPAAIAATMSRRSGNARMSRVPSARDSIELLLSRLRGRDHIVAAPPAEQAGEEALEPVDEYEIGRHEEQAEQCRDQQTADDSATH